jgi:hypothetical protein
MRPTVGPAFTDLDCQRNRFDITARALPESFPPKWAAGYLNDAETQQALAVPVNWTGQSVPVAVGMFDSRCLLSRVYMYKTTQINDTNRL